jgi:hypothetical protein
VRSPSDTFWSSSTHLRTIGADKDDQVIASRLAPRVC